MHWVLEEADRIGPTRAEEIRELWERDPHASGFAAPSFLNHMIETTRAEAGRVLLARGTDGDGRLTALWPLRIDPSGTLEFLQSHQGDHCTCLSIPSVPASELAGGLERALEHSGARSVFLARIPPWGPTLAAARAATARIAWWCRLFAATPCPVLSVPPGHDSAQQLAAEIGRHKRVRTYENKLRRQPGFAFEVLEDAAELERWAAEFCDAHEWRWDRTATPSEFRFRHRREFLLACLRAWQADGTLVRFAVELGGERLAFAAAVVAKDRLTYHLVVTSPAGDPFRAGHVLIRLIGLWMVERKLRILDFGVGLEGYKLRYANGDEALWRLRGARRPVARAYGAALIEERIRGADRLQRLWDVWGNQRLRGAIANGARVLRTRLRNFRNIHLVAPRGVLLGLMKNKLTDRREIFYRASARRGEPDAEVAELSAFEALDMLERERGVLAAARADTFASVHRGARAFGVRDGGRVVHVSWLVPAEPTAIPAWIEPGEASVWCIRDVVTARSVRGRGIYPRVLQHLLSVVAPDDLVIIYTDCWNEASRRGIRKAGFEPFALRTTPRRAEAGRFESLPPGLEESRVA